MVTKPKTKDVQEEDVKVQEVEPSQTVVDIKHVIRTISWDGTFREEGAQPGSVIEDYLNQTFFAQGYSLYQVVHLQDVSSEGVAFATAMLYILVKYAQ